MNCREVLALQTEYIDGDLSKNDARKIRSHLKTCDACRQEFSDMENLLYTLRGLDDIPVPENLADDVIAAIKEGPQKEKRVFVLPRFLRSWQTYSVAAACILLFTAVSTDINQRAAVSNTSYVYTMESVAPKAVEIPASFVTDTAPDEITLPEAIAPSPAPIPSMRLKPAENPESVSALDFALPIVPTPTAASAPIPASPQNNEATMGLPKPIPEEPVAEKPVTEKSDAKGSVTHMASQTEEASVPSPAAPAEAPIDSNDFKVFSPKAVIPEIVHAFSSYDESEKPSETRDASSAASPAQGASKPTPAPPAYNTVGSLVKRRVTFVVDDADAQAVFESAKSGGVTSVKNALYQAGIDFSTRESVINELAPEYNALVKEANSLSARIAAGNTSLRSQLSQKEAEMQALKDSCKNPSLSLSFE